MLHDDLLIETIIDCEGGDTAFTTPTLPVFDVKISRITITVCQLRCMTHFTMRNSIMWELIIIVTK